MIYQIVSERHAPAYKIGGPGDAFSVLKRYASAKTERFIVITLDGAHQVKATRIISMGLVNRTIVHAREVFYPAITDHAVAIIIAHNHPSGLLEPSSEDFDITRRLSDAGELLGIPVLDHVIISKSGYYSLVEHGLMKPS
jgi:DNA repair protein RadC